MVVPKTAFGARTLAVILLTAAVLLSGCTASKEETESEVLSEKARTSSDANGEDFSITVPKGVTRLVITFDTRSQSGGTVPGCGQWCADNPYFGGENDAEDQVGTVELNVDGPGGEDWGTTMGHGGTDRAIFDDPTPGVWDVSVDYEDDYNGAFHMRAESTAPAGGGVTYLITDNMLEIAGLVLTVGGIAGAGILYKRRGNFLRRELHKIDETVHLFKDDVDECRTNLMELQEHLKDLLVKRKIEDSHYLILEKRIDRYLADLDTPGNRHAAATATGAATGPAAAATHTTARQQRKSFIIEEPTEWEPL